MLIVPLYLLPKPPGLPPCWRRRLQELQNPGAVANIQQDKHIWRVSHTVSLSKSAWGKRRKFLGVSIIRTRSLTHKGNTVYLTVWPITPQQPNWSIHLLAMVQGSMRGRQWWGICREVSDCLAVSQHHVRVSEEWIPYISPLPPQQNERQEQMCIWSTCCQQTIRSIYAS